MRGHEEDIAAAGAGIAAIGTGDRRYAQAFAEERGISFPLLLDEGLESYRIVEARRASTGELIGPSVLFAGARALARRNMQGRTGRHPLQLGATHVIRPDGSVPLAWVNDDVGDNAPVSAVLDALR